MSTYGIPYTDPKSGCKLRTPHEAIRVAELGSTGSADTSAFHGLSAGKTRREPSAPPITALSGCVPDVPGSPDAVSPDAEQAAHRLSAATHRVRIARRIACARECVVTRE